MVLATMLVPASPAWADELTLNPLAAPVGAAVTVKPGVTDPINSERICYVFWDNDDIPVAKFTCGTDDKGDLATTDIPAQGPPGPHSIVVRCPNCTSSSFEQSWGALAGFTTQSTVPKLLGLSYADIAIQQRLDDAVLRLGNRTGSTDPPATVISQIPEAGTVVEPGTAVDLVFGVIPQPQLVRVPDLLNSNPTDAAKTLTAKRLTLGTVTGTGLIATQDPSAGRWVTAGTAVNVKLARPPIRVPLVTVPNLIGLTIKGAGSLLVAHRLKLGPFTGTGRVINQDPPAQSQAAPDSQVTVVLGASRHDLFVTVPDLKGLTGSDAAQLLNVDQLTLGTVSGAGRVSSQTPAPHAKVRPDTAVNITLTNPAPVLVTVPDLRGLKISAASTMIRDDGLKLDTGGATAGVVVSQRPSAGSRMPAGTTVSVSVRQPAVILAAAHGSIPWGEIAVLALATVLVSTAGWLSWKRWPAARTASRRLPRSYPLAGKHVDVRCEVAPPNLKITTVGSIASPVGITVHGCDPNIKVKEVQK